MAFVVSQRPAAGPQQLKLHSFRIRHKRPWPPPTQGGATRGQVRRSTKLRRKGRPSCWDPHTRRLLHDDQPLGAHGIPLLMGRHGLHLGSNGVEEVVEGNLRQGGVHGNLACSRNHGWGVGRRRISRQPRGGLDGNAAEAKRASPRPCSATQRTYTHQRRGVASGGGSDNVGPRPLAVTRSVPKPAATQAAAGEPAGGHPVSPG